MPYGEEASWCVFMKHSHETPQGTVAYVEDLTVVREGLKGNAKRI